MDWRIDIAHRISLLVCVLISGSLAFAQSIPQDVKSYV
jgi:hypothetical protein